MHDFLLYDPAKQTPLPYENRMPIFSDLLEKYPNNTRMYKFIADPPTTTMQRLKALTTGSLPTFIDAGSNFATQEIVEDNVIDQVVLNHYSAVFTGDDTWTSLYPNRFLRSYPYPSFDVWDLNTVDNGVKKQIFFELQNDDWNLLVGHFLGVDHCGHRYGPNHPEMRRKLEEINDVIEKMVTILPDNTMLVVVGDHGMTITGDHGGDSIEEITAGMFVYSKPNLWFYKEESPISVKQVDLIPTLSTILGIPIPFQNLGVVILDCLPINSVAKVPNSWHLVLPPLWENVKQIVDYLKVTSQNSKVISDSLLNKFIQRFSSLSYDFLNVNSSETFLKFNKNARLYLNDVRKIYEEAWVQFDTSLMTNGLLFIFLTVFFVFIIIDGFPIRSLVVFFNKFALSHFCVGVISSFCCLLGVLLFSVPANISNNIFFITSIISHLLFAYLTIRNWDIISLNWYDKNQKNKVVGFITKIMVIFNIFITFSNSYVNEESTIYLFSLTTVFLLGAVNVGSCLYFDTVFKKKCDKQGIHKGVIVKFVLPALVSMFFVRFSVYFWRCRVEQEWCLSSVDSSNSWVKFETSKLQWGISGLFLAVFVISTKEWLKHLGNLNGLLTSVLLMKFAPTVIVVCIAGYWVLENLPGQQNNLRSVNYLALFVYGLITICVFTLFMKPLCVYMLPKNTDMTITSDENVIPQLYKKIKNCLFEFKRNVKKYEDIPVVYGLGTVYSAAFFIIGIYLVLLFNLLLGVATGPSAIIMFAALCFTLIITSVWRVRNAKNIDNLFDVPNFCVLIWIVLTQYFFYATGHQPTFSNIHWEAAFVGTSGLIRNNFVLGTLIIINTFCSNILMGTLLPLLLISPFSIVIIVPSVIAKKSELLKTFSRGELVLFEKEHLTNAAIFTLMCKYIAGHSIRVFGSMLAATIHCRHLMVWAIFAPKLIFELIGLFVTIASVICGFCFFNRINVKVNVLVNKLNKSG